MLTSFTHTYAVFSHQLSLIQTLPVHTHTHTQVMLSMHKHPLPPHTQAHSARAHHPCPEGAAGDSSPWRPGPVEACELRGSRTGDRAQPAEGEPLEARACRQVWGEPRPYLTRGTPGAPCHSLSYYGAPAAVTVHSCTSPSTWLPCSPCPLSRAGSGSHGAAGALPLREGPPWPRPRSCRADLPIPARHLHTCPEAPGWAMHTVGTHSRLAKPPGQDRSLTKVLIPTVHPEDGAKVRGQAREAQGLGSPQLRPLPRDSHFLRFFLFWKKK